MSKGAVLDNRGVASPYVYDISRQALRDLLPHIACGRLYYDPYDGHDDLDGVRYVVVSGSYDSADNEVMHWSSLCVRACWAEGDDAVDTLAFWLSIDEGLGLDLNAYEIWCVRDDDEDEDSELVMSSSGRTYDLDDPNISRLFDADLCESPELASLVGTGTDPQVWYDTYCKLHEEKHGVPFVLEEVSPQI